MLFHSHKKWKRGWRQASTQLGYTYQLFLPSDFLCDATVSHGFTYNSEIWFRSSPLKKFRSLGLAKKSAFILYRFLAKLRNLCATSLTNRKQQLRPTVLESWNSKDVPPKSDLHTHTHLHKHGDYLEVTITFPPADQTSGNIRNASHRQNR